MSKVTIDGEEWPINIFTVTILYLAASCLFTLVIGILLIGGMFATLVYVIIFIGTAIQDILNLIIAIFKFLFKKKNT